MKRIKTLTPRLPLTLICSFEDGEIKQIDLRPIVHLPVFHFLSNEADFMQVVNREYFIEWPKFEADLSAETLWNWDPKTLVSPQIRK